MLRITHNFLTSPERKYENDDDVIECYSLFLFVGTNI